MNFKSIMLAGALAVTGAFTTMHADAATFKVSGVFNIEAINYNPTGNDGQRETRSQATAANFNNIAGGSPTIGTVNGRDVFTYTGALAFRIGSSFSGPNGVTTIAEFLGSAGGMLGGLDTTFGGLTNSAGAGGGDGGNGTVFKTTTIYKITAASFSNISSLADLRFAMHDDGITVLGSNGTSVASVGPNSERETQLPGLTGGANNFVMYYASANGDPSVLEVNAVPLPAAAWLLLGVAGALVAAKRRSALRAA
jgi:hypothetical protein